MAIFRPGPLVAAISGNLGAVNFATAQRAPVVRSRMTKTNPASPEQLKVRNAYNRLWKLWQSLASNEQTPWTVAALQFPRTNRLGLDNPLTGWQLFYETNFYNVWQVTPSSSAFVPLPPPLSAAQALTDLVLTATRDLAFQLTVRSLIPSTDQDHPGILTIKAWRPHTNLIKKLYRAPRRLLRVPFEATTISIADEFVDIFGTPALGEAIRLEFAHIADDAAAPTDADLLTRKSAVITRTVNITETDPNPFEAPAMNYDGANDFSLRGADLTGNANTRIATFSGFFRTTDVAANPKACLNNTSNRIDYAFQTANILQVQLRDIAGTIRALVTFPDPIPSDGTWHNFCISIDSNFPRVSAAVDGLEVAPVVTTLDAAVEYDWTALEWGFGRRVGGTGPFDGCMSMIWFSNTDSLDFTSEDVRALFVQPDGSPTDLGGAGQFPTGTSPIIFFPGGDGAQNSGTGGDFVNNAGVVDCVTTP